MMKTDAVDSRHPAEQGESLGYLDTLPRYPEKLLRPLKLRCSVWTDEFCVRFNAVPEPFTGFRVECVHEWQVAYRRLYFRRSDAPTCDLLLCQHGGIELSVDVFGSVTNMFVNRGEAVYVPAGMTYRLASMWMSGARLLVFVGGLSRDSSPMPLPRHDREPGPTGKFHDPRFQAG